MLPAWAISRTRAAAAPIRVAASDSTPAELGGGCGYDCHPGGDQNAPPYSLPSVCPDPGVSTVSTWIPIGDPDVPACCSSGFEIGDAKRGAVYTIAATSAQGSRAWTADVDFAAYEVADEVVATAFDAANKPTEVLDTCLLTTSDAGDSTGGQYRPSTDTIRQFHMKVPARTVKIAFDFKGVVSPMYLRVLGLCDFQVAAFNSAVRWTPVGTASDGGTCATQ